MDDNEVVTKKRKTYRIAKKRKNVASETQDTDNAEDTKGTEDETQIDSSDLDGLIPDIEDYLSATMSAEEPNVVELPPVIKFRKNWTLSVTDLSSQLWCEKQTELMLITGRKRVTKEMEQGTERHEQLELEDHEVVEVAVETNEDSLGIKLLNSINLIDQLMATGKCRELWVFANINGYVLRGIIDQLEIIKSGPSQKKKVLISDTKTRNKKCKPSASQMQGAALQVQAYCIMLEKMRSGNEEFDALYKAFECDKDAPFVAAELVDEGCLAMLERRFKNAFMRLPEIATTMQLSYEHEGEVFNTSDIDLQESSTMYTIQYLCDFWDGHRHAEPVRKQESWKCKMCEYREECDVSPLPKEPRTKDALPSGQLLIDSFLKTRTQNESSKR
ncbi:Probable exonuclease V [Babesia bigemina]|uniref:Probable exonuclease V n=1 Tax=Babesia bigemina TaxID=5866 RepID=A0A061DDB4_BABBI|nr:Probable exonuclease V [Babesia bigemina]CDR96125.1 Probable exonuclease V [Babesia bigemina]|eukprot:XP_012768311.1 Probable exonuclease V [Babesia bigemina]